MKVKMIVDIYADKHYKKGEVVDIDSKRAERWEKYHIAIPIKTKKKEKKENAGKSDGS